MKTVLRKPVATVLTLVVLWIGIGSMTAPVSAQPSRSASESRPSLSSPVALKAVVAAAAAVAVSTIGWALAIGCVVLLSERPTPPTALD